MIKSIYRCIKRRFYTQKVKKQAHRYGKGLCVNGRSNVTDKTILGNNVNFNGMSITGGGNVKIGDNFHSGRDCMIISQNHNYDLGNAIPYDRSYICRDVVIKDNVWLGERVIVLAGAIIGEGAIIQAGSVVVSEIPDYAIAGGHPAKVFKYRDIDHYNKLRSEGKFF